MSHKTCDLVNKDGLVHGLRLGLSLKEKSKLNLRTYKCRYRITMYPTNLTKDNPA